MGSIAAVCPDLAIIEHYCIVLERKEAVLVGSSCSLQLSIPLLTVFAATFLYTTIVSNSDIAIYSLRGINLSSLVSPSGPSLQAHDIPSIISGNLTSKLCMKEEAGTEARTVFSTLALSWRDVQKAIVV
jgi:hypothetical protein